jgi:hypothetical protein
MEIDKGAGLMSRHHQQVVFTHRSLRIILSDETNNLCQIADRVWRIDYFVIHFGISFRTSSAGVPPWSSIKRIPLINGRKHLVSFFNLLGLKPVPQFGTLSGCQLFDCLLYFNQIANIKAVNWKAGP